MALIMTSNPFMMKPTRSRKYPSRRQYREGDVTNGIIDIGKMAIVGGVTVGVLQALKQ
jgi:hypothetical protein